MLNCTKVKHYSGTWTKTNTSVNIYHTQSPALIGFSLHLFRIHCYTLIYKSPPYQVQQKELFYYSPIGNKINGKHFYLQLQNYTIYI